MYDLAAIAPQHACIDKPFGREFGGGETVCALNGSIDDAA